MEGENPTRRYKSFRPRQAMLGSYLSTAPTHTATISLFNNSTGAQYLVVRDLFIPTVSAAPAFVSQQQGQIGTTAGLQQPVVSSNAALPGLVFFNDTTTVYNSAWLWSNGSFSHEFPLAVLLPGWSFVVQARTGAQALAVGFIWEAIFADELDFAFEF